MEAKIARTHYSKFDLPPVPPFLQGRYIRGNFTEGTLQTRYGTRVVVLPEDLVLGLHQAIEYETGRAWKLVAYTCGRKWGERLLRMMQREWRDHHHHQLEHLDYHVFEAWLTQYFEFNGWGTLEVSFDLEDQGLVEFRLRDSILDRLLSEFDDDYVNEIFAGVLGATSSWLAGRELDCIEITSTRVGAPHSRMIVGLPGNVAEARRLRAAGAELDELLEALRVTPPPRS